MAPKKKGKQDREVSIPALGIETVELKLVGTSPLIVHAWSQKAKKQMRDKQMGKAKQGKTPKVPAQDFVDSCYWLDGSGNLMNPPQLDKDPDVAYEQAMEAVAKGTFGITAISLKLSAVFGAGFVDGQTKVGTRGAFHVVGEYVEIEHDEPPIMREDMVRVGMGTADLRYRPEFANWACTLKVELNKSAMSLEQMVNLFNVGGFSAGIGDWRPEKNGANGRFKVA